MCTIAVMLQRAGRGPELCVYNRELVAVHGRPPRLVLWRQRPLVLRSVRESFLPLLVLVGGLCWFFVLQDHHLFRNRLMRIEAIDGGHSGCLGFEGGGGAWVPMFRFCTAGS